LAPSAAYLAHYYYALFWVILLGYFFAFLTEATGDTPNNAT